GDIFQVFAILFAVVALAFAAEEQKKGDLQTASGHILGYGHGYGGYGGYGGY
ncbi:unnamed protein product, partial [Allacma fusca]